MSTTETTSTNGTAIRLHRAATVLHVPTEEADRG